MAKLMVALDLPSAKERAAVLALCEGSVDGVKVGMETVVDVGLPNSIGVKDGVTLMADLKLHDIPRTVAAAVKQCVARGYDWVTVHAGAGYEAIVAAQHAGRGTCKVAVVGTLSSLPSTEEDMLRAGALAVRSGAKGMIVPGQWIDSIRVSFPELETFTPGIRPRGLMLDDHVQFTTPYTVRDDGGDWGIVGRPITESSVPQVAAAEFKRQLGSW